MNSTHTLCRALTQLRYNDIKTIILFDHWSNTILECCLVVVFQVNENLFMKFFWNFYCFNLNLNSTAFSERKHFVLKHTVLSFHSKFEMVK